MLTLSNNSKKNFKTWSSNKKNNDAIIAIATTIKVPCRVSLPVGQETLKLDQEVKRIMTQLLP